MKRLINRIRPVLALAVTAALALPLSAIPIVAQAQDQTAEVPEMRSRLLTTLTGWEVTEYLKRNDVIFVPVGPVEHNGGYPVDVEYVIPLAYAQEMAAQGDGLVMPYLAYFYPGGTTSSPATVHVSTSESLPYLKALTRSLIRQGFRRIVFLTAHGPSGNTMLPLVREIFDETHVPVLWMGVNLVRPPVAPGEPQPTGFGGGGPNTFRHMAYGAYELVGRLNDLPVGLSQPKHEVILRDPSNLSRWVPPTAGTPAGSFYGDPVDHGGFVEPVTAEQRAQWGREGAEYIRSQVSGFDVNGMLGALRTRYEFTKQLQEVYGNLLPGTGH